MRSFRKLLLVLAVLGIVLLLPMASGVETPAGIPDTDSDGVPDPWDICPVDTSLPEVTVPSEGLNTNRFALVDGDAVFDTRAPKGKGPDRSYSLDGSVGSPTCGCSCEQILAFSDGKKEGEFKFGCSIGIMDGFVRTRCEVDADGDGFRISDGDCDDSDPLRNPEATEECNGVDDDCDGLVPPDEADADGDGYRGCDGDCDDADPSIHPGATETCNGIDDDCDGQIDEGAALTYYLDADGDGYGGMETVQACGAPTGYVETPGDCDDANPSVYPGAVELCDGLDTNCDGKLSAGEADADGDGFRVCDGDCDDTNSAVHPGASEICDGLDNDCDGEVDEGVRLSFYRDADGDGYGSRETLQDCSAPTGYAAVSGDCDDLNPAIYPGAAEVCDGKDNDCDVIVDEGFDQDADRFTSCGGDCDDNDPEVYPGFPETCDQKDNDCDGQVDEGFDRDGDGFPGWYSGCGNDCDDADPLTYPGAPEVCDGKDNDCDGETDEGVETAFYRDEDGDGLGGTGTILACSLPSGASAGTGDCDDRDPARSPGTTEICDGKDNDCDGQVDEDLPLVTFYRDADGDGFGGAETVQACSAPAGYVDVPGDCDDADPGIHPGAEEVCDGKDNNCDGEIDEFLLSTFFRDADGDGYGGAETVRACSAPAGYVDVPGDCDDASAAVSPAVTEVCDGLDNDCDGLIDEDLALLTLYRDADADGFGGTMALETCSATLPGYIADSTDCDDTDLFTHPGATEICDGKDNNCDGQVDEGLLLTFYQDADGDGYGGTVTTTACTAPQGHVANSRDCNDADAGVHPGATEIPCDGIDQNCNGAADDGLTDADRDGWTECAGDCNDSNPNINPGVVETGTTLCDSIDQDCDGKDDCSARFVASDGAVLDTETGLSWLSNGMCLGPGRYVRGGTWDTVPSLTERVSLLGDGQCGLSDGSGPGNWRVSTIGEIQNLFRHGYCLDEQLGDQFYYGTPDTLCLGNAAGTYRWKPGDAFADLLYLGKYLTEPGKHWYYYYTSESAGAGYQSGVILYNTTMCRISGSSQECRIYVTFAYASTFGTTWDGGFVWPVRDKLVDNDGDGYYRGLDCDDTDPAIHPGATEVCDGIDNNCDGRIDEVCDSDGDGYTPEGGDCNDNDATIHPGATEVCDGKDNDCDGQVDEGVTQTFYRDGDGDGYGGTATILACIAPAGYVANSGDCNDNDAGVNPAAPDPCDGRDTNCDGREENRHVYFRDQDGDGFGALPATLACSAPTGYVDDRKDCDDTNPAINPLGTEVCDGKDNDCDGQVDEGLRQTFYWDRDRDGVGGSDTIQACTQPPGAVTSTGDCNDNDWWVYPGATEYCDGKDNDCDGAVDEPDGLVCRFADKGDGTVLDTATGLYWLKKADLGGGTMTLAETRALVKNVADGNNGLSDGSWAGAWRLPTIDEMSGLCGYRCGGPGGLCSLGNAAGIGPWREGDAFSRVPVNPSNVYWTDTTADSGRQRLFAVYGGYCLGLPWLSAEPDWPFYYSYHAWPVREALVDNDGDGYHDLAGPRVGEDCDDTNPSVNPGMTESCNGIDDDCDGRVDETCDYDFDGFTPEQGDCEDRNASINPSQEEEINGIDDNCDGHIDERFTDKGDGTVLDNLRHIRWLKDPSGIPPRTWLEAVNTVAALGDGQYGLSDGSKPGDWKLPTVAEFNTLADPRFAYDQWGDCQCEVLDLPKYYRKCWLEVPTGPALSNSQGNAHWSEGDPFLDVDELNTACDGDCQRLCQHQYISSGGFVIAIPWGECVGQTQVCNLNLFWTRETVGAYLGVDWSELTDPKSTRECRSCGSVWGNVIQGYWGDWPWSDPGGTCCVTYDINRGTPPDYWPGYDCNQKLKVWPWRPA